MKSFTGPVVSKGSLSMKLPPYRFIRDLNGDILAKIIESQGCKIGEMDNPEDEDFIVIYSKKPINIHNSVFQLAYEDEEND